MITMTDREMLLMAYGAMRGLKSSEGFKLVLDVIEEHLFTTTNIVVNKPEKLGLAARAATGPRPIGDGTWVENTDDEKRKY